MEVLRRVHGRQEYIVGTYNNQLQAPVHPPGVVSSECTSYLKLTLTLAPPLLFGVPTEPLRAPAAGAQNANAWLPANAGLSTRDGFWVSTYHYSAFKRDATRTRLRQCTSPQPCSQTDRCSSADNAPQTVQGAVLFALETYIDFGHVWAVLATAWFESDASQASPHH